MELRDKYGDRAALALRMWTKLARASMTFGKLATSHIRTFGMTEPQFGVIECLGHLGPMALGKLSRKRLVSGGNMTCVVDNLEEAGLVERIPSETDRRTTLVRLTPKGTTVFDATFRQHAAFIASAASVLTIREQETLAGLLKKLGCSLRNRSLNDFSQHQPPSPER